MAVGWKRVSTAIGSAALLLAATASRALDPDGDEMQFLWEVNRARSDPPGWALEHGLQNVTGGDGLPTRLQRVLAKPPLALSPLLFDSAQAKAQEFIDGDYFAHESPVTGWPNNLVRNVFGYPLPVFLFIDPCDPCVLDDFGNQVESLATSFGPDGGDFATAVGAVTGLIVDEGTIRHRIHLLGIRTDPTLRTARFMIEAGAGHAQELETGGTTHYWAFHTGVRSPAVSFLTGVAFADANGNALYDPGEGLGGVTVNASALSTTTNGAGGWAIQAPDGSHDVTCSGGGFTGTASAADVAVDGENREVDCLSGIAQASIDFVPEPAAPLLGVAAGAVLVALARRRRPGGSRRERHG